MFQLIYAEKVLPNNELSKIVCRGMTEFIPYRRDGYSSTDQWNDQADAEIFRLDHMSETSLEYLSGMRCMDRERAELVRRRQIWLN